jgi:light-regulated signal transduction histidine kinase (bacteriophytochrome)
MVEHSLEIVSRELVARNEELRRLNAEIARRADELAAANHELEAFSYSVSHDLQAPLRAMGGFCQILMDEHASQLDDTGRHYLQRIDSASRRMTDLIEGLLSLARLSRSTLTFQLVDLSDLARWIARGLAEADPTRDVRFVVASGLTAEGDRRLLQVVLENLLRNAWKFTAKHARARIEVGSTAAGDECAFFVRDDGAGFDMTYSSKLFGAFQRLHLATEFEGTGIGLATVQRIIKRHGGRIWAEGEVEKGATFYFTLPGELRSPAIEYP